MEISIDGVAGVDGDTSNVKDASKFFANSDAACKIAYSLESTNSAGVPTWLKIDGTTGVVTVDLAAPPDYSFSTPGTISVVATGSVPDDPPGAPGDPPPANPAPVPVKVGLTIQIAVCADNQGLNDAAVTEATMSVTYTAGSDPKAYQFDSSNPYRVK